MPDLFSTAGLTEAPKDEAIAPGAMLLRGFALPFVDGILAALGEIAAQAPFRHMATQWGAAMSVAMTNCGEAGWLSDHAGYRYDRIDPETGRPWPALPDAVAALAARAAAAAGYPDFAADACLINRYEPGARLSLHQDRNERDFAQPIVSVSLGLPAVFLRGRALRGPLDREGLRRLFAADSVWGAAALLWLATGLLRAFGGLEKGSAFYLASRLFWLKLALFALVVVLEIWPMLTLMRWRRAVGSGRAPDTSAAPALFHLNHVELALVVIIVFVASFMARGFGLG